jgi:hypothetical protein
MPGLWLPQETIDKLHFLQARTNEFAEVLIDRLIDRELAATELAAAGGSSRRHAGHGRDGGAMSATQAAQLYVVDVYESSGLDVASAVVRRAEEIALARGSYVVTTADVMQADREVEAAA